MLVWRLWGSIPKSNTTYRFAMSAPCYKQTRRDKSSYLLRSVETDEHERLDTQHRMNLHMMHQNILHPSIPKNFERVADIATGNGTWLFDLIKARKEDPESSNTKTRYHGFDISPALFPKENHPALSSADLDFSRHDFYKPFPEEHIGQYDLVHARHLSLAVPIPDLDLAVKNITSLLKPGGHIQWEEYDYRDQLANCPPSKMTDTWHVILAWVADHGYSMTFSSAVHDAVKAAGLDMIEQRQFTTGGLPFCEDHRMTLLYAFDTGIPRRCLKAQGGSDEEVEGIVGECLEEWESGVLLDYYLSRVVARKGD